MATTPDPRLAPKRELAAIMFSDIAGYTAIMGRDERAGLAAREAHRDLLRSILPRFHGRLLGDLGDGALSSFHSAIDAVSCARAFQAATGDDPEFKVRIGIHVGDVLFADNTVLGDGVNVASRLVALAAPGGICISERVHEEIRNKPEFEVDDLGLHQLKNVDRPIRVYALAIKDSARDRNTRAAAERGVRSPSKYVIFGIAAVAVGALVLLVAIKKLTAPDQGTSAVNAHVIRSIAVLPLDNYSGDPGQDYFADGMTDELTTDLATISQLRVISRGSVMQFKGEHRPPTPQIAKLLNVDAVVEGSVMRSGDKVRITAQLIDAPADRHLWAKTYERDTRDVLALQDEVASAIAGEIEAELTPSEQARLTTPATVNPEAHDAYLRGRYFFSRVDDTNLQKAIQQFDDAIRIDPNFAPAYAGLSDAYLWAGTNEGVFTAGEAMPKAREAAEKAVQLDDSSAEAHASLGNIKYNYEFDLAGAEREFKRAIELNPNYAYAYDQYGVMLAAEGRLDEALAQNHRAAELDPLSILIMGDAIFMLTWQGKFDAAKVISAKMDDVSSTNFFPPWFRGWIDIEAGKPADAVPQLERSRARDGAPLVLAWLGYAYGASGDRSKAIATMDELRKKSVRGEIAPYNLALIYMGMGDRERALDYLEKALAAHSIWISFLKMERVFAPLHSEPRFIALLKKMNFDSTNMETRSGTS